MTAAVDAPPEAEIEQVTISWASAAWLPALILVATLFVLTGFRSRDPDSALHAAIVAQSYQRPVTQWIAPSWGGQWGRDDLYREHPAAIFLLPSALARAGYPAEQAAYAVNAVFQILTILMTARFATLLASSLHSNSFSCRSWRRPCCGPWRQALQVCAEALIERVPDIKENLIQQHQLTGLSHALKRRVEYNATRPIERISALFLSYASFWLKAIGLKKIGLDLYRLALYPKGSVGRE